MAIAYETSGTADNISGYLLYNTSSGSATVDVGSSTDRILWVAMNSDYNGTDIVTSLTYNGSALTKLVGRRLNTSTQYISLWYLVNPSSGSNSISITSSANHYCACVWNVYSGAPAATTVIGTNTASGEVASGNLALTLTTEGDNAWLVSVARSTDSGVQTAGSNTTERYDYNMGFGDTNGVMTPAGSYSQNWSADGGGNKIGGIAGHFYVGGSSTPYRRRSNLALMGVS